MTEPTSKRRQTSPWGLLITAVLPVVGCLGARSQQVPAPRLVNRAHRVSEAELPSVSSAAPITKPAFTNPPAEIGGTARLATATINPLPAEIEPKTAPRDWRYIVLHHSATDQGSVESIDREHRERRDGSGNPWLGIGYHFVIGNGNGMADGHIEPTFRWIRQLHGAHAGSSDHNERGIGICLIGDFDAHAPTPRQVASVERLLRALNQRFQLTLDDVLPHHELKATACPGRHFPLKEILTHLNDEAATVARRTPRPAPASAGPP